MAGRRSRPQRVIKYTVAALDDLAGIHIVTTGRWCVDQGDRYVQYILNAVEAAPDSPTPKPVDGLPGYLVEFVRWRNSRHGHFAVFRREGAQLVVIRILHSAMDLSSQLEAAGQSAETDTE